MDCALRVLLIDRDPDRLAAAEARLRAEFPGIRLEPAGDPVDLLPEAALDPLRPLDPLDPSLESSRLLFDQLPALVWVTDRDLVFSLVLGRSLANLDAGTTAGAGTSVHHWFGTNEGSTLPIAAHLAALAGDSRSYEMDWRGRVYATQVEPLRDLSGAIVGCIGVALDITERKRTERALRDSEERYALAMSGANAGLWDWDLDAETIYYSPRFRSILGYSKTELDQSPDDWLQRVHAEDMRALDAALGAHLAGLTPHLESEHRVLHKDGRYRWMLCRGLSVREPDGRAVRMAGSLVDITDRKASEQQLLHDAFHDSLTGLPNRALFLDRLDRSLARATRNPDHRVAVLFLDLDRFKLINDSLGHPMGDRLLIETSRRLERCIRPEDTVARLGGDEFAILLESIGAVNDAVRVADRIQHKLRSPVALGGQEVFASASIGISASSPATLQADSLIREADTAMLRAKALSSRTPVVFDELMHVNVLARLQMETSLRRAIEREEISVHFQPIVDLATGRLAEFEALARWRPGDGGSPAEFIPIAEETGLIIPLGHWVLTQACKRMVDWRRRFPEQRDVSVSVNLSSKQFAQPGLIERIDAVLAETGLPGDRLTIELTESVLMENSLRAAAMLAELRTRGIQLCIDDFGTGYSSLSYLHSFPFDRLKLDATFVSRIARNPRDLEIVRAVVTLAHNLSLQVTAEGIEDDDQLAHLLDLGCDFGQGFLFGRPAAAEDLEELLGRAEPLLAPPPGVEDFDLDRQAS